jgi:hypothetical protein
MNSLHDLSLHMVNQNQVASIRSKAATNLGVVLVREAGVPSQPLAANADPFIEWLSLMEVVQMLCPEWPVRDRPIAGKRWKL